MDKIFVDVTYDEQRGYVGSSTALRTPVVALSLRMLRQRIEERLLPDEPEIRLVLDRGARQERDRRRRGGHGGASQWSR